MHRCHDQDRTALLGILRSSKRSIPSLDPRSISYTYWVLALLSLLYLDHSCMNQPAGRKFLPLVEEGKGVCKANQVFSDPYWSSSEPEHLSQQISPLLFDLCHLSKQSTLEYPGSH